MLPGHSRVILTSTNWFLYGFGCLLSRTHHIENKHSRTPLLCPNGWCIKWRECLFSVSVWVSVAVEGRKVLRDNEWRCECVRLWGDVYSSFVGVISSLLDYFLSQQYVCFVRVSQRLLSVCFHLMDLLIPGKWWFKVPPHQQTFVTELGLFLTKHVKHYKYDKMILVNKKCDKTNSYMKSYNRHNIKELGIYKLMHKSLLRPCEQLCTSTAFASQ